MLSRQFYWRIRFNFFRLHYQFIMASDRRAPYDYFLLVCGPVPVAAWARDPNGVLAAFCSRRQSGRRRDLPGAARSATCSA